jgi:hypothetical protein
MKKKTSILILFLMTLLSASFITAQKPDYSGEWKLNKEKSTITDPQLFLSKISIQVKSDSLFTTRVYENGNGEEYPFEENLSLDGKDCKMVVYEMPRTSKATRSTDDGAIMIASATTFNNGNGPEDMTANETWKLDSEGNFLTLTFTNKMSGNESKGTYFFEKAK